MTLTRCATLRILLNSSKLQSSHLKTPGIHSRHLMEQAGGANVLADVTSSARYQALS